MKQRRSEDEPKKEGAKTPFFCVYAANTFSGHLTKREQRKKAAPKPQKTHPKVRKNEVSIAASFFAKQVVLLCTQKVLPLGGDGLRANSEKRHKNRQGHF